MVIKLSFTKNHMQTWQRIKNNPELISNFLVREKVIDAIRTFFKSQKFTEVETPLLVESPGTEPFLEVFKTELKSPSYKLKTAFLTTSPELNMKKLLVAGLGNIFQICKSFRNQEGLSDMHNPEFTILEWYRVDANYLQIMRDCEDLITAISKQVFPDQSDQILHYQNKVYDLNLPWDRISVAQAFQKYAGIDTETLLSEIELPLVAVKKGYQASKETTWEEAFHQILLNEIEPNLGTNRPTFLYDYPISQAALSRKKQNDPRFAERFELFLAGLEIGNAFSELTNWQEQEARMQKDLQERRIFGKENFQIDDQFIEALKQGMPETGGIAVGVDRLVMLFTNAKSIRDTLFFPVEDVFKLE